MIEIIRNLLRRKTRTWLTISGIFIGILALTVLGALAERVNMMTDSAERLFADHILVTAHTTAENLGMITGDQVALIESADGVQSVRPIVELPYAGARGVPFAPRPLVRGIELSGEGKGAFATLSLRAGRFLERGDRGVVVAGADLAADNGWRVGDTIIIEGEPFKLVGIVNRMISSIDQWLFVPLDDARMLFIRSVPLLRTMIQSELMDATATGIDLRSLATSLQVVWDDGVDPNELTRMLQHQMPELTFVSPHAMKEMLSRDTVAINLIVLGSSLIALIVGGLSVVNTMTTAVRERRSEIAIKKALGASTGHIVREYMAESALLGFIGGLLGVLGGILMVRWLNSAGALSNTAMFLITGRLIVFCLVFAILLGCISGLLPALHAAGLHPIDGLREE